ncbi:MAG: aminopeptidase [Ruthenibacterium sp.]
MKKANDILMEQYAEFAVRIGVNPQPGQTFLIRAPIEGAHFARCCAAVAYGLGVREVVVHYTDEKLSRMKMQYTQIDVLEDIKPWNLRSYMDYAQSEGGACVLSIIARDPEIYKGLDSAKIDRANAAVSKEMKPWHDLTMTDKIQWSIVAIPSAAWAKKVFPRLSSDKAQKKLWKAIFEVCRVTDGNVVQAWQRHIEQMTARRDRMNALCLDSLHLISRNGTNLTIGLAEDAVWEGAQSKTPQGTAFIANIPTEEVFTAPHRLRTNGVAVATKPYVYNGNVIDGFSVTFQDGIVVDYNARVGKELLGQLLDTDEGARHIGEIALVPVTSPINRSGLLFYNTLFDENAACHIAFGAGYPGTVTGGTKMTTEQLLAKGVNDSLVHEDIMVGAPDMRIIGTTKAGETVLLFQNGNWAF